MGSEDTLAIITKVTLRLVPKPPARATLMALFTDIQAAVDAVTGLIRRRVVPATLELIDRESLQAVSAHIGREVAPAGTGAMLIVEADGAQSAVDEEIDRVTRVLPRSRCKPGRTRR